MRRRYHCGCRKRRRRTHKAREGTEAQKPLLVPSQTGEVAEHTKLERALKPVLTFRIWDGWASSRVAEHTKLERALKPVEVRILGEALVREVAEHTKLERALKLVTLNGRADDQGFRRRTHKAREGTETPLVDHVLGQGMPQVAEHTKLERALKLIAWKGDSTRSTSALIWSQNTQSSRGH